MSIRAPFFLPALFALLQGLYHTGHAIPPLTYFSKQEGETQAGREFS